MYAYLHTGATDMQISPTHTATNQISVLPCDGLTARNLKLERFQQCAPCALVVEGLTGALAGSLPASGSRSPSGWV